MRAPQPLPAYRCCPACAQRRRGRVNPACPVCQGAGVIVLGRRTRRIDTDAALESIELALEQAATRHLGDNPAGEALRTGPAVLTATVTRMVDHGLVADPAIDATAAVVLARHREGTLTRTQLATIAQLIAAEARNPQPTPTNQPETRMSQPISANTSPRRNPHTP